MRSRNVVLSGVIFVTVAVSGLAQAANTPAVPPPAQPVQPIGTAPVVRVMDFSAEAASGTLYSSGGILLKATLWTNSNTPLPVSVKLGIGPATLTENVTLPAHATDFAVKFKDPIGLVSGCEQRKYLLAVEGHGPTRHAYVDPTCTFGASVVDPWNQMTPDHAQHLREDSLYISSTVVESPATCKTGLKAKVSLRNNSKATSPSLVVNASANGVVKSNTPAAFPIGANQSKDVILEPYGAQSGEPTQVTLGIVDWTKSMAGHVGAQGVTITPTRSCALHGGVEPEGHD
jgi:hypothetical protein